MKRAYVELCGYLGLVCCATMLLVPICIGGCSAPSKELEQIKKPAKYKITLEWDAVCTEIPALDTNMDGSFSIRLKNPGNSKAQMKSFTMTCDGVPVEPEKPVQAEKPETKP